MNIEKLRRKLAARELAYKANPTQQNRLRVSETLRRLERAPIEDSEAVRRRTWIDYQRSLDW